MVNRILYGYVEIGFNIVLVIELVLRVRNWIVILVFLEFILVGLCFYLFGFYLML